MSAVKPHSTNFSWITRSPHSHYLPWALHFVRGTYIQSTPPAHPYSTLQTIDDGTPDPDLVLALSSIMEDPHDPDLPWSILLPACPIRRTTVLPPIPYALSCQVRSLR